MVCGCLDTVYTQYLSQLLHLLTRQAVDDAALAGVLLDKLDDILVYILCLGTYLVVQVRTVERTLELSGIHDAQVLLDIRAYLICSCSRQRNDRCITYLIYYRTDTTVLRTEVMSPL